MIKEKFKLLGILLLAVVTALTIVLVVLPLIAELIIN
jgi:hypothetical protein